MKIINLNEKQIEINSIMKMIKYLHKGIKRSTVENIFKI